MGLLVEYFTNEIDNWIRTRSDSHHRGHDKIADGAKNAVDRANGANEFQRRVKAQHRA